MPDISKQKVAVAALEYIGNDDIVGVGSGSTVGLFIQALAGIKHRIQGVVASSNETEQLLRSHHIPVIPTNQVTSLSVYIDSADEIDPQLRMIKGGGAALTGEKIVASLAKQWICICDSSKYVKQLGAYPLPIEVIAKAQSAIARKLVGFKATPRLRMKQDKILLTDYGNPILDVSGLDMTQPCKLEQELNQWAGVVANGLFCCRPADILLLASDNSLEVITASNS